MIKKQTLLDDVNETSKDINNSIVDCLYSINTTIKNLTNKYSPSLIELLSVLESNQDDMNFINEEGTAIGKYMKDKGYSKQEIEILIFNILKYFD